MAYPASELPPNIDTNFPYENLFARELLFSGGGGSYKVYLRIVPQKLIVEYGPRP
ncbi:hypothetical protein [Parafrankia sp. BMG5.11]|uniref:hypothetical protein n=1 Tax=Parafrankia sp. BMG5.11 TaxID=222540 RepID=UPI000DA58A3C|nr:hypothetical protein [Parafrankia sp. BMG5.11]SQD97337.1 hypothetical protein FMEAI12_4020066 [Parafrankia sp. Ea1.12]